MGLDATPIGARFSIMTFESTLHTLYMGVAAFPNPQKTIQKGRQHAANPAKICQPYGKERANVTTTIRMTAENIRQLSAGAIRIAIALQNFPETGVDRTGLARLTGLQPDTIRKALTELRNMGCFEESIVPPVADLTNQQASDYQNLKRTGFDPANSRKILSEYSHALIVAALDELQKAMRFRSIESRPGFVLSYLRQNLAHAAEFERKNNGGYEQLWNT